MLKSDMFKIEKTVLDKVAKKNTICKGNHYFIFSLLKLVYYEKDYFSLHPISFTGNKHHVLH